MKTNSRAEESRGASSHNLRLISIRLEGRWIWSELCKKDSLTFHAIDAWVDSPHVLANDAVPLASVSDGPVSSQLFGAMDHCRGPLQTRLWVCVWNAWSVSLERRFSPKRSHWFLQLPCLTSSGETAIIFETPIKENYVMYVFTHMSSQPCWPC